MTKGGKMFTTIFSAVFLFFILLAFLIGALKARKKVWQFSLVRIIMKVISAVLAAFISLFVSWFALSALADFLLGSNILDSLLTDIDINAIIAEVPSAKIFVLAIASMIVAPLLFLLFYLLCRIITGCLTKPISRAISKKPAHTEATAEGEEAEKSKKMLKKEKKERKKNALKLEKGSFASFILGGACGALTLCVLLVPLVGTLDVVDDISSLALHNMGKQEGLEMVDTVADVMDSAANNVGSVTVRTLGGGALYDMMTSYPVNGEFITLKKESGFVKSVANTVVSFSDENASTEDRVGGLNDVTASFENSTLMPTLISELVSAASGHWSEGESFYGIDMPELGGEELQPVVMAAIDGLSQSDVTTIKQDVRTIVDIVATLVENDAISEIGENPISFLKHETVTSELFYALLENPRLNVAVDGIADFGIGMFMEAVQAHPRKAELYDEMLVALSRVNGENEEAVAAALQEVYDTYGLEVGEDIIAKGAAARMQGQDLGAWTRANVVSSSEDYLSKTVIITTDMVTAGKETITDNAGEAKKLAHAFSVICGIVDDVNEDSFEPKVMLSKMGPILDSFAETETIGKEHTKYMLEGLLQSELVHDSIGFTVVEATEAAASMADNAVTKGYTSMLVSLSSVVDVVESAADPNKNTADAVIEMLDDLTPEAANVIQSMVTPAVVQKQGVPEKSAPSVSTAISNTFGNLSDAKESGMSDEEYEKESHAVADMMNIMMSSGNTSNGGSTFGDGSHTGKSADDYVDTALDSKVITKTVVETVYGEGDTPNMDPFESDRNLSEQEKDEFLSATNRKWSEKEQTESQQKEIIALGAIMNVQLELVDGQWVAVQ